MLESVDEEESLDDVSLLVDEEWSELSLLSLLLLLLLLLLLDDSEDSDCAEEDGARSRFFVSTELTNSDALEASLCFPRVTVFAPIFCICLRCVSKAAIAAAAPPPPPGRNGIIGGAGNAGALVAGLLELAAERDSRAGEGRAGMRGRSSSVAAWREGRSVES